MNSGLEVNTKFFFMQWMLFFVQPTVEINGQPYKVPWGVQFAPLAPGNYHVKIYYNWMVGPASVAESQIQVLDPSARHQAVRDLSRHRRAVSGHRRIPPIGVGQVPVIT